jgi:hypothetical protein
VLRSEADFAETASALPGSGQTLLFEGQKTQVVDTEVVDGTAYYYSVFIRDEQGNWRREAKTRLARRTRQLSLDVENAPTTSRGIIRARAWKAWVDKQRADPSKNVWD